MLRGLLQTDNYRRNVVLLKARVSRHLLAGATGLVGSRLTAKLAAQGNKVRVLTRDVNRAKAKLQYPNLEFYSLSQIQQAVNGADAVVNLAGTPIGTRCGNICSSAS